MIQLQHVHVDEIRLQLEPLAELPRQRRGKGALGLRGRGRVEPQVHKGARRLAPAEVKVAVLLDADHEVLLVLAGDGLDELGAALVERLARQGRDRPTDRDVQIGHENTSHLGPLQAERLLAVVDRAEKVCVVAVDAQANLR